LNAIPTNVQSCIQRGWIVLLVTRGEQGDFSPGVWEYYSFEIVEL
jgi:hypothetical protein